MKSSNMSWILSEIGINVKLIIYPFKGEEFYVFLNIRLTILASNTLDLVVCSNLNRLQ